jgi:hypothetical protein
MIRDANEALTILRRGPIDRADPGSDEDRVKEATDFLILQDPRFMVHALQGLAIFLGKLSDRTRQLERQILGP